MSGGILGPTPHPAWNGLLRLLERKRIHLLCVALDGLVQTDLSLQPYSS